MSRPNPPPKWFWYAVGGGLLFMLVSQRKKVGAAVDRASDVVGAYLGDPFAVLTTEAPKYGIDPRVARAIMQVESGGSPFGKDGRLIIRFEPHVFVKMLARKRLGKRKVSDAEIRSMPAVLNPGMSAPTNAEGHKRTGGQAGEWDTLARAKQVDPEVAIQSTSFGLGQIMGFNYAAAGYPSAQAMFDAFQRDAAEQVRGMLRFIAGDPQKVEAMRSMDFPAFVARYNGAPVGTAANQSYVKRMVKAYSALA